MKRCLGILRYDERLQQAVEFVRRLVKVARNPRLWQFGRPCIVVHHLRKTFKLVENLRFHDKVDGGRKARVETLRCRGTTREQNSKHSTTASATVCSNGSEGFIEHSIDTLYPLELIVQDKTRLHTPWETDRLGDGILVCEGKMNLLTECGIDSCGLSEVGWTRQDDEMTRQEIIFLFLGIAKIPSIGTGVGSSDVVDLWGSRWRGGIAGVGRLFWLDNAALRTRSRLYTRDRGRQSTTQHGV